MSLSVALSGIVKGKQPLDFNWNCDKHTSSLIPKISPPEPQVNQLNKVIINDEGLRDGLHGVSDYPTFPAMMRYVRAVHRMKINLMTVGIYSGDGLISKTTKKLLRGMAKEYPKITPIILSLTTDDSLVWAAECAKINPKTQVLVFMGSSPSRLMVEGWSKNYVLQKLGWAIKRAVQKYKLFVIGATEHTTQTPPDFLRRIITTQIKAGARILCIADTIGICRPIGVFRIVKFFKKVLRSRGAKNILLDWHGHRDLGYSLANTMAAISAGADRVHLTPLGIGERSGNVPLEKFVINANRILIEAGYLPRWDLTNLSSMLDIYAEITNNERPTYGCIGKKAFFTSLGIHTAAILKAEKLAKEAAKKGYPDIAFQLEEMARRVYAGVDPYTIGRKYQIGIGPYSGSSTVKLWAISKGLKEPTKKTIKKVLTTAKELRRSLLDKEIFRMFN